MKRRCVTCGHDEFDVHGKPTHTFSFCWMDGCDLQHLFAAEVPPRGDQRKCAEEGCSRAIIFVPGTGFGSKGDWQHVGGQPLGQMRAHMARPKVYIS